MANLKEYASLSTLRTFLANLKETFASLTHTHSYDDLRNKPFYEGTDYSSIFANGTSTVNFYEWGSGVYGAAVTDAPKVLAQDVSHKVIWDGVEYTMTCTYGGDNEAGNPITSLGAPYGDYSDYPFGIDSYMTASGTYEYSIHTNSTDATHTIDILEFGSSFVTLDDRFISNNIARTADVDGAIENINTSISNKADKTHTHLISDTTNLQTTLDGKVPTSRTVNGKALTANITLSASDVGAASSSHNHDDRYYTETEIDSKLASKSDTTHNHDSDYDTKGAADGALTSAKSYTDSKTSGLASTTVVDNKVSAHNTSTSAHNDIRDLIDGLTTRLNTLANSDDTTLDQMSEVVAYIKNNKSLIDGITTSKINVSDIVNNLTTNSTSKVLSAAQGVAIKALIDALQTEVDGKVTAVSGKGLSTNDYTTTEKNKLSGIASGAEVNQNAFSNIAVSGQTTVAADAKTDTVTFAGSNVTITTDATNDKVTFTVADGTTSAKGVVQLTNSTSSTSTTTAATPSSVKSAYDLANQAKTAAATAQSTADGKANASHTHTVANITDLTATATELNYMDGVTSGVQTQLDGKAASDHTHTAEDLGFMQAGSIYGAPIFGDNNLNNWTLPGVYNCPSGATNVPSGLSDNYGVVAVFNAYWNTNNIIQLFSPWTSDKSKVYMRTKNKGTWNAWKQIAAADEVLPLTGGTLTGTLNVPRIYTDNEAATLGSADSPFQQVYAKSTYIHDGTNYMKSYGSLRMVTEGTTSTVGQARLDLGNGSSGSAGNAQGTIRLYGTGTAYHTIQGAPTSNRTITLPNKSGTLATTDDVSTTAVMTTAEYEALGEDEINANTLYMLTDTEEPTPTQVQIVTWEADD